MPKYLENALTKFYHILLDKPEHAPYIHAIPSYGAKVQYKKQVDTTGDLDKKGINTIQQNSRDVSILWHCYIQHHPPNTY